MIGTVQDMVDETGVDGSIIRAYLTMWRKRGWARFTGRTVPPVERGIGRKNLRLHEVRDSIWERFLRRDMPASDLTLLPPREYLHAAKERQRNRVAHTKRLYRALRRESFARRYPFVVLTDA